MIAEGWFSNKWKKQHLVLHNDSMLMWYKELGDIDPDGYSVLKVNACVVYSILKVSAGVHNVSADVLSVSA